MSYEAPYKSLKVVDLSQGIAGPYCTMLMAQYGAEVIKIEPEDGDWVRHLGQVHGKHSAFSVVGNLGKRSVVLDLKDAADCDALWRMLEDADVLFEGFRPGVMERLGFDYERVRSRNPRILYVSVSGFGQRGPLSAKPAMDPVLQAFTGFMVANSNESGTPQRCVPIVVDMSTALYAFQAVSAALFARQHETQGRRIEVSLLEAAANLQAVRMMQTHLQPDLPVSGTAPAGAFRCQDDKHLFIVIMRQHDFVSFCEVMGLEELTHDPRFGSPRDRFDNMEAVNEQVARVFLQAPAAHWSEKLTAAGLQNEQVLNYHEFLAHEHVRETDAVAWLTQPGFDVPVPVVNIPGAVPLRDGSALAHAPETGEHTEEVLGDHGIRRPR